MNRRILIAPAALAVFAGSSPAAAAPPAEGAATAAPIGVQATSAEMNKPHERRSGIVAGFDTQSPSAKADLVDLDHLAGMPLATTLPELGGALRELRNLRATRALAQPASLKPLISPATPAAAPPTSTNPNGAGP